MTGNITFKLADKNYETIIFSWLAEPHMIEILICQEYNTTILISKACKFKSE